MLNMIEALGSTKDSFELFFNLVPSAIFAVDKEMRVRLWNKKAEEITGYSSQDMMGRECIIFAEHPCKDKCGLFSDDVKKPILAKECTIRRKDGELRTILKNAELLRDDKGNVICGVESFEDITRRKQFEERLREARAELEIRVKVRTAELSRVNEDLRKEINERKKSEESLRQGERFLSSIFSSIQDGISILDKDNNIIRVNPTMEKWYAYSLPLVGKKCFQAYHCRNAPCEACPAVETLKTGKAAYETLPKRGPGGGIVGCLDIYSFPLFDKETGQMQGIIEYVRDVSDKKLVEDKLVILNKEMLKSNKRLKQLSLKDSHTGLYNHRYLQEVIEPEFQRARRYVHPLTVIMLDIDYFKSINDVYGHQFGDLVLKQFADQLKRMVRRYDIVIRFGGEEFIVVSPGTARAGAIDLARRLLDGINICNFGDKKHTVKLKLSLAVATYPEDRAIKGADLINLSDQILNKAKEFGGNRVYSSRDIKKQRPALPETGKESAEVKLLNAKIEKLTKRANQSLVEAIFAFAKTIELKDHYTGAHVEMTVKYAQDIARRLGLSVLEIEQIGQAAMLHDLGKIGISENILLKKLKLTKKEFEEIKKHPQIAADIIRPVQFLHNLIPFIFYHHERWDGKGYPSGIKGEEIPLGARIIAIADVYQALTSNRPYRKAYSEKEAIKIIRNSSGTQFDPAIVDVLLQILQEEK